MVIRFKYDDYKANEISKLNGTTPSDAGEIEDLSILNEFKHPNMSSGYHQTRDRDIYYVDVEKYVKLRKSKKNNVHPYTAHVIQRAIDKINLINKRDDILDDILDEPKPKFNLFKCITGIIKIF